MNRQQSVEVRKPFLGDQVQSYGDPTGVRETLSALLKRDLCYVGVSVLLGAHQVAWPP